MSDRKALILFLTLAVGGGLLIGMMTAPGAWYDGLQKPRFNPPGWVFGPVWTLLYVLIGIAGWRSWQSGDARLHRLWWGQMALNFLWSPTFFAAQQVGLALVIILALLAAILFFVIRAWPRDPTAALLFAPYLAWVAFATVLNASIWVLNG